MKNRSTTLFQLAAAMALVAAATPAQAVLQDHGPSDPTLIFPQWYRDLNNVPLGLCLSQNPSPNPLAGLKPMCFPLAPDPAGFPGNVGPEVFYNNVNQKITGPNGFKLVYIAGLEASYLPAGLPIHGTEAVFARIRAFLTPPVSGTYTVTHPFGVEVFPDLTAGQILRFTADVGLTTGDFNAALAGRVGPWIQWIGSNPDGMTNPGESLTNSAGEQFVGDPNFPHNFTGSPFGTNYIQVDGPLGADLDGLGHNSVRVDTANVMGQRWLTAIPTPLTVKRATYSRNPAGLNTVDVWVTSSPAARLILTAQDMPSLQMTGDGLGNFFSHIEYPANVLQPNFVTVTNMSDNPVTQVTAGLVDLVEIPNATFDTLTRTLAVNATSSDLSGPVLTVLGPLGGQMTAGAYSTILPATSVPPIKISVGSTAGGSGTADLVVLPGLPMNPAVTPVVVSDAFTVSAGTTTAMAVGANDPSAGTMLIITPPASGTATLGAAGVINYAPAANFTGADSLQYVVQDATGAVSNVATVSITVQFAALPPTANGDQWAQQIGLVKTVNVIANDAAASGTTLDPASIVITAPPASGTATPNLDGTITYSAVGASGIVTFSYTVSNNFGQASAPATVSVLVEGSPESITYQKINYTVSKAKWTIVGQTTWFNPAFTQMTATCWLNVAGNPIIGTAPIDPLTGKFQLVPLTGPKPTNPASITCQTSNGGSKPGGVIFN